MPITPKEGRLAIWSTFEFDLVTLRLRRRGLRLRLEQKPAQLLARLLEEPGQIVERNELIERLWPEEVHGEFDQRLNKAVHKVRCALGDDPENPRFVQTLSRYGYRFIGDVEFINGVHSFVERTRLGAEEGRTAPLRQSATDSGQTENPVGTLPIYPASVDDSTSENRKAAATGRTRSFRIRNSRIIHILWTLSAGLVVAAFLFSRWASHRFHPARPRTVAVLSFTNLNGNPADQWLSAAFSEWLTSDLMAGGDLQAIPRNQIARFQSEQGISDLDQTSPGLLSKMRHDLGSDLVVSGSYASSGTDGRSTMRLDVQVRDSRSGRRLYAVSASGTRTEIFDLAASAASQLRKKLGLSAPDRSGLSPVRAMLPTDPDAARFYAEGTDELDRFDPVDARVLLQRAIALEPEHALSHSALSTADTMLGFSSEAKSEAKQALDLAGSLPTEQRLLVEGQFYEANYDWDRAMEVYSRLFQMFPESAEHGIRLAQVQTLAGRAQVALETIAQLREAPVGANDEARIDLAEAEAASSLSDFRRQRDAAAHAAITASASHATQLLARAEEQEGEALRALGNVAEALALWKDAEARYTAIGDHSGVVRLLIDQGRVRWQQGDPHGAEANYLTAVSISRQIGDQTNLGRALTALGQVRMYEVGQAEGNRLCQQALEIFHRTGNNQEEAYTLSVMGDIAFADHAEAIRLYERSLELSREVNDRSRTAGRLMDLGIEATVQGHLDTAESYLQQSLALFREIGERDREALQFNLLAIVRTWQGRLPEAESLSTEAVTILNSIGEAVQLAQSRETLGIVQMEEGRFADAESTLRLAIQEHREAHNPGGVAIASGQLAEVLLKERKLTESKVALHAYDAVFPESSRGRMFNGEHVTEREILEALSYAADDEAQRAHEEAVRACNDALRFDQGSMLLKARLVRGEIEFESGNRTAATSELNTLIRDADQRGFGLISHDAHLFLKHAQPGVKASNIQ